MVKTIAGADKAKKPHTRFRISAEIRETALTLLKQHGDPATVARQMNGLLNKEQILGIALKAAKQLVNTPGLAPEFQDLLARQIARGLPVKPQRIPDDIIVEALRLTQSVPLTSDYFHRVSEARAGALANSHNLPRRILNAQDYQRERARLAAIFNPFGHRLPQPSQS
jgi:hypothetical protein